MDRYLVAGLGNPGREYRGTRHNIGFEALETLAERYRIELSEEKFDSDFASGRIRGQSVYLLKPRTMMNRSGKAVATAARYHDIDAERILVLHDDVDLQLGRLKIKAGGGHGGHNGLRDIANRLDSKEFRRVRCGIGRPDRGSVRDHVLSSFADDERPVADEVVEVAADAAEVVLTDGPSEAQNQFNGRDLSHREP